MRHRRIVSVFLMTIFAASYSGQLEAARPLSGTLHIHDIAFGPADSSLLFVATHQGVFLIAPDGMGSQVSDEASDVTSIVFDPGDPMRLLMSGHLSNGRSLGVVTSRDSGHSWQESPLGVDGPRDFNDLAVSPAAPDVLYGVSQWVYISRDGGTVWETTGSTPSTVHDLAVSAYDPGILYAATEKGLLLSLDEGKTWDPIAGDQGEPATMVQSGPDGSVYAFIVGSGLIKAPASNLVWAPLSAEIPDDVMLRLAIDSSNDSHMFAVTQHSRIIRSVDGGVSWTAFGS